jgi:hypothetical protein
MVARMVFALSAAVLVLAAAPQPARAQNLCISNAQCATDRVCMQRGLVRTCQIRWCNANRDCPAARAVCDRGLCQMACASSAQCPPTRYCKIIPGSGGRGVCEPRRPPTPGR